MNSPSTSAPLPVTALCAILAMMLTNSAAMAFLKLVSSFEAFEIPTIVRINAASAIAEERKNSPPEEVFALTKEAAEFSGRPFTNM